jgi:hypothetical protein
MEETETYTSVALWGTGETDTRSASALLEDFLPKKLGSVLRPESTGRGSLRSVINWLEGDDQLGENGTVSSVDLVRDLLALRDTEGDDIIFIALWPGSPAKADIALAESAVSAGIRVLDLCAALDELVITDEMREVANPVPEKPKRLTKAQKDEAAKLEKELAEVRAKESLELEIARAAELARSMEAPVVKADSGVNHPDTELLTAIREIIREEIRYALDIRDQRDGSPVPDYGDSGEKEVPLGTKPGGLFGRMFPGSVKPVEILAEEVAQVKSNLPKSRRGFPVEEVPVTGKLPDDLDDSPEVPFEGPYTDGKLEYYEYNGNYRRANGKPRRGEVTVWLTPAGVEAKRYEWSTEP